MKNYLDLNDQDIPKGKVPTAESGIEIKKTVCDICNPQSHCGIDAYVKDGVVIKVEGTKENPHSSGTLCSKGAATRQYIYNKDRLLEPMIRTGERGSDDFKPISWDAALDLIAEKFKTIKAESGPESTAFFVGYPKWMRPYVKRLAHSFGSPNYLTESSTCFAATLLASKLTYGGWGAPDVANTKCLLVWSANPFYSNSSVVHKILNAVDRGMKIIEVGPFITPMTKHADIHLRLRPGTSGALALGIANYIIQHNLHDKAFVDNWTVGFDEYAAYASEFTLEKTAAITGVPIENIRRAAKLYADTKPAAMWTSASPTVHHTNATQNHRAIISLVGLTGNFDIKGGNHVLPPGYAEINNGILMRESAFKQSRPWEEMAPRVGADAHPVWAAEIDSGQSMHLPKQINSRKPYPIRALLGFGLNHRMWPGSQDMAAALKKLDFLVDVDIFMTDTAKMADLVLPACTSFERSEFKIYAERYGIYTEPVFEPLGQSRSDTDIIFDLAKRIVPEDELLCSDLDSCVDWMLEPQGLTVADIKGNPAGCYLKGVEAPGYRKYEKNGFATPSGKMEFASSKLADAGYDALPIYTEPMHSPLSTPELAKDYPLVLNTGSRLPMYVHSRTFRTAWTRNLRPDPMLDINPADAKERGLVEDDKLSLSTPKGSITLYARLTETVPKGVVAVLHGLPGADVNTVIDGDYRDPISGYPGFKSLLCQVTKQ
jgi:anaerobic selenocysteine-containing dehydrogenase